MKKLLIGFLAVGLIMGFAMTASAQPNIKASGQLYMYGSYVDKISFKDTDSPRANVGNRFRMQFEIQIQEGLKLTTRFDALERAWGENPAAAAPSPTPSTAQMGAIATERNISWERAFVTFNALYGVFDVGYQQSFIWGTCAFCDDYDSDAGVTYRYMMGPWTFGAEWFKRAESRTLSAASGTFPYTPAQSGEGSRQGGYTVGGSDNDHDIYDVYAIYRWAQGQAGLRFQFDRDATGSRATTPPITGEPTAAFYELAPYAQFVYGPFSFEGEFRYIWGKIEFNQSLAPGQADIDRRGYSLYLNPKYTMGAFYGGLEFAWISGDDPTTTDKLEAGIPGGQAWDPLLMYGNYWFNKYQGTLGTTRDKTGALTGIPASPLSNGNETNMIMFKPYVGWKINPQLELVAQFAWLKADEKPAASATAPRFIDDEIGKEFDVYATYKIYNNLSYTVGFGYFWAGDYFKGTDPSVQLKDTYMFMNALNLTF